MRSCADDLDPTARAQAEALLGRPLRDAVKIGGGANSRVYRVFDGSAHFALKLYPHDDRRDRLGAELTALRFLHRHGMRDVPQVVAADRERRIGVYEWIEGTPVDRPGDGDIEAAVRLLGTLHRLRDAEPPSSFPLAAEACLSPGELAAQVERRFARLAEVAEQPALAAFLAGGVAPVLADARAHAEDRIAAAGLAFAADLPPAQRSLSPSDFGFHNAIRRSDGSLVFCDFEYFGWDDPVKPVADFLLHPGMTPTDAQRRAFTAGALSLYGVDATLGLRLRALFPVYGLRWCLILLNEFLPERWAHRVAAGAAADRDTVLARQLLKAQALLETARRSIAAFPWSE